MTLNKIINFLFRNQNLRQTVMKNTFWLTVNQVVSRLLRTIIVIYAARLLGVSSWGAFSYALTLAAFLSIFSDIGIAGLVTREASRNVSLRHQYFSTAFVIKLILLIVLIAVFLMLSPFLTRVPEVLMLLPLVAVLTAFDSLRDLGSSIARATERMEVEAGVNIFTNIAIVTLGLIALILSPTSLSLTFAYALGSALGLAAYAVTLKEYFLNLPRHFTKSLVKPILTSAWPYGLLGLMGVVMINTDIIMINFFRTIKEVGLYSAAQKPIQLLYILPGFLAVPLFPVMSRLAKDNIERFRSIFEKAIHLAVVLAVPLTLGGLLYGHFIIEFLYGTPYAASTLSFQILALTFITVFPSILIGNAIFAFDEQKSFLIYTLIGIGGNAFLDILLIPRFGIEGSAWATTINSAVIALYAYYRIKKIIPLSIAPRLPKTFIAAIVMIIFAFLASIFRIPEMMALILSGLVYLATLILLKDQLYVELRSFLRFR